MEERSCLRNLFASATVKNQDLVSLETQSINTPMPLMPLKASANNVVLVNYNRDPDEIPKPYPETYCDSWDSDHVRLPCSPCNVFSGGNVWEKICEIFRQAICDADELQKAILSANLELSPKWGFESLANLLTEVMDSAEREEFFSFVLPGIVRLALSLPEVCTQPIPLLGRQRTRSLTMSQQQIGSLLANAFLCTFPVRSGPEYRNYPFINFGHLYSPTKGPRSRAKMEKIRCLINYFRRIVSQMPTGLVTFCRQHVLSFPNWSESKKSLRLLVAHREGTIEDGDGLLQMDFANKRVGGGVLKTGCVQEEIRFVLCPELIVSRLFTESLDDNEVLVVTGCERYNSYNGYGDLFRWAGNYRDDAVSDEWGRKVTQVVAADATRFVKPLDQYKHHYLLRELNKAYCAFHEDASDGRLLNAVATGNWGCGAYRGDAKLKSLLQLMAASEAGRDLVYYTFGDPSLRNDLQEMCDFLRSRNITVGELWRVLSGYEGVCTVGKKAVYPRLYQYIRLSFSSE